MHVTNLGGHSGCKILLCETDDEKLFVRKIAGDMNYNSRLKQQAEKQKAFHSEFVKTPKIFGSGYVGEVYYFDMEYISGITLAEYMKSIQIGKIRGLVDSIVKSVISTGDSSCVVKTKVFKNKIASLKETLKDNASIKEALGLLEKHSWSKFKQTFCHGDLTLENIIVKDGQLYYIDFLDSFYDSWIMDISTLMQDVQTMWAYRFEKEKDVNTLLRLIVFRDILIDKVKEMVGRDYIEVYYALLLKLIRIYPYTSDQETISFLDGKVKSIMEIIRKEEEVCEP
ncbi:MAG: phosphotransferase [Bacteroidales bacterium]|nr:phosphotransferase [Lachnoclostridium sp.]MCM1384128.1 phosphotransferase [Lachnoclostridium sp.]MCM1465688.1 phosphotransferase [Bacteroidales bacterium]